MDQRICKACNLPKPIEEFDVDRHLKSGRKGKCRECTTKYGRHYYSQNKGVYRRYAEKNRERRLTYYRARSAQHVALVRMIKADQLCTDCGENFPAVCFDFDHVVPGKRHNVTKMANHSARAVHAELERCELVCANCHRLRTQSRRAPSTENGRLQQFRAWTTILKADPCTDCGRSYPAVAMDFDHVRGEKVAGISQMWCWNHEKVLVELAKCDLVCANCHRVRTHQPDVAPVTYVLPETRF